MYYINKLLLLLLLLLLVKVKICRTIIWPVVLYGRETSSLTLREERRLRVFENRVLRRVFGPKRDEVTGNATTHCGFVFCSPLAGYSLLAYEVS